MAGRLVCRAVGVFQLSRTPRLWTGTRFYSQTEPEPLTVRHQNDGIRCSTEMSPPSCQCSSQVQILYIYGENIDFNRNSMSQKLIHFFIKH